MTAHGAKPARRTQEQRRTATRAALLDATVDCLIEYGYAGVTTTKVVERAGVSRGAQVHHFPTKAQLVAEAVAHLARRRADELVPEIGKLPRGPRRLDAVLDMLWQAHSGPLFHAALELWVASRTDQELREHMARVELEVTRTIFDSAAELFGEVAASKDFRTNVEVSLAAMRGLALLAIVDNDARRWAETRTRLRDLFVAASTDGQPHMS